MASQAQSELAEIETDIDLAAYEPSTVRPNSQWLAARRKRLDEIGALGSPLLLSADKHRRVPRKSPSGLKLWLALRGR